MRKEHPKLVFVKHTFCCLSCHIHSILSRGSVCCLACDDLSFLNWRNVCEAFTKDTFYVALPLYCDLFSCLRLLCFWIHVFLCCFHFFFCIRKIKWDSVIHTANLESPSSMDSYMSWFEKMQWQRYVTHMVLCTKLARAQRTVTQQACSWRKAL